MQLPKGNAGMIRDMLRWLFAALVAALIWWGAVKVLLYLAEVIEPQSQSIEETILGGVSNECLYRA